MACVDVIIPNRNGRAVLPGCLAALEAQTYRGFSTLVVDDASTDDCIARVRCDFPAVGILQLPRGLGFAGAVNSGIRATRAPYVALLNSDAEPAPDWLAELVPAIEQHPEVGWCASKMLFPNGLINSAGQVFLPRGHAADIGFGEPERPEFAQPRYVFGACAGAALYRRRMLQAVGLFDDDFFMLAEDVDLSFRAQLAGWRCLYVPGATVIHRHAATRRALGSLNEFYSVRNSLYCDLKNLPTSLWLKYMTSFLRYQWSAAFEWTARGRWRAWAAAHWSLLADLRTVLRKRAQVQDGAAISAGQLERSFWPQPLEPRRR
ncbi:MAG TPA: glycosyltransferase family 2 protein [Armatimonadota bacterium]|nr:glycosyltransferase family 2 protein [Armatimonadota bacterium]